MLEATAKDETGKQIFAAKRIYMSQCTDSRGPLMVLGPDKKLGIVRDTTFQPFAPKQEEFEVRLAAPVRKVDLELRLTYVLRPGDEIPIHRWQRRVAVEGLFKP